LFKPDIMNENELKALISLLDDTDFEVRQMVEKKIFDLGDSIIPFLEESWTKELSENSRTRIEEMVQQIQSSALEKRLLTWKDNNANDLLEGVWAVATYQYPTLKKDDLVKQIDKYYYEIWFDLRENMHPYDQIKIFNYHFFGKNLFRGNNQDFHAINNSMINSVLESKKGSPILLCVVYLLIAQRLNLPIYGVNLPNLFILTYKIEGMQFYINAFNRGLIFSRSDIDSYLSKLNLNSNPVFYEPCTHLDIVLRILRNMMLSYEKLGDAVRYEEIKQLMSLLS